MRKLITEMSAEKSIIISTHILEEVDAVLAGDDHRRGRIVVGRHADRLAARSTRGSLDDVFRAVTADA